MDLSFWKYDFETLFVVIEQFLKPRLSKSSLQNGLFLRILKIEFALLLDIYTPYISAQRYQMNPKRFLYDTALSAQIPCLAGHSL